MLEIIGHILAAMLLFKGVGFICSAATHGTEKTGNFMISILAGIAAIIAALYFYNQVSDQASGARRAFDTTGQQIDEAPEAVAPQYGQ